MNSRKLNRKITIQKSTSIRDQNKASKNEWRNYKNVWASTINLFGKEYWRAKKYNAENTVVFTIRYIPELTTEDRILFDGKIFNISSIDNIKYENKYLKIKALEVH